MADTKTSGIEVVDAFSGKKWLAHDEDAVAKIGDKALFRGCIDFRTNDEIMSEAQRVFGVTPLTDGSNTIAMWSMLFEKLGFKLSEHWATQHNYAKCVLDASLVAGNKARRAEATAVKKQVEKMTASELVVINAWVAGHDAGLTDQKIYDDLVKKDTSKELLTKFFPNIAKK